MRSLRPFVAGTVILVAGISWVTAQTYTAKPQSSSTKRPTTTSNSKNLVMREPFTLRLKIDKEHYQEFHYDKQPYVSENEVYLFSGDKFGVNLIVKADRVMEVRYQPDVTKADVVFGFEQPKELQDGVAMALTIDNKIKCDVGMEVMGSVPGKKDPFKDKIVPVKAGKSNTEFWPHPIAQLVLGNFQLPPKETTQPKN
jgi:hypothetical protein